ncbi:MAG: aspartate kinase [bacterium]
MLKVAKFGGSSVRDAKAIKRCGRIVTLDPDIKIVVISATANTSNELERIALLATQAKGWEQALEDLVTRHRGLIHDLDLEEGEWFHSLENELWELGDLFREEMKIDPARMDQFYSIGERISSAIVAHYFEHSFLQRRVELIDARGLIHTDNCYGAANPDRGMIADSAPLHFRMSEDALFVTQGFIGADGEGHTTTLGREGSDYSATLIAEAMNADAVQIWTDVAGLRVIDPKLVPAAPIIKEIDYACAAEMARHGAKILFSKTLDPVVEKGIPVFIGSSLNADAGGTWIKSGVFSDGFVGIAVHERRDLYKTTVVGRFKSELLADFEQFIISRKPLSTTMNLESEEFNKLIKLLIG